MLIRFGSAHDYTGFYNPQTAVFSNNQFSTNTVPSSSGDQFIHTKKIQLRFGDIYELDDNYKGINSPHNPDRYNDTTSLRSDRAGKDYGFTDLEIPRLINARGRHESAIYAVKKAENDLKLAKNQLKNAARELDQVEDDAISNAISPPMIPS